MTFWEMGCASSLDQKSQWTHTRWQAAIFPLVQQTPDRPWKMSFTSVHEAKIIYIVYKIKMAHLGNLGDREKPWNPFQSLWGQRGWCGDEKGSCSFSACKKKNIKTERQEECEKARWCPWLTDMELIADCRLWFGLAGLAMPSTISLHSDLMAAAKSKNKDLGIAQIHIL